MHLPDENHKESRQSLNPKLKQRLGAKKRKLSLEEYIDGIRSGDRMILGRAITLIESLSTEHQKKAQQIIEQCLPFVQPSIRIGITGAPGVGKSTFIEALGKKLVEQGKKLAILAIDPSSQLSKGSILGDKTRMIDLSSHPNAFIRPSPTGDTLGGVARKTRETIILCEAAGYDTILIETVGVGQSEIAVRSMVDFFLLLLLPGAGDELQGIKRGIVEMADMIVVNKAEEERLKLAKQAKRSYRNALHLFPPKESQWIPPVEICSALKHEGISNIWDKIIEYKTFVEENGFFEKNRSDQARFWLKESISDRLQQLFYTDEKILKAYPELEQAVLKGEKSPFIAAEMLINLFK
jgi:LAO/AO transport system kinase